MATPQEQVLAKCKEVFARAMELYGTDLSKVAVRFDLKGRCGGMASARGNPRSYHMRFNYDMLMRETGEIVNVVVPHEIAHIVCYMNPKLGHHHDSGWARVCRTLGGTGDRTHDMDVVYGKGITYEYTTDRGHKVRLNDRRHEIVQRGQTLTYRKGMGTVTSACAYSVVGVRGQTLATPVVKQGAPTKEVPVATLMPVVITELVPAIADPARDWYGIPAPRVAGTIGHTVPVGGLGPMTTPHVAAAVAGESKAATSRRIMLSGYRAGHSYETIITAMIAANGYSRQLARATYLANAPKIGIPAQ